MDRKKIVWSKFNSTYKTELFWGSFIRAPPLAASVQSDRKRNCAKPA
ncbi:hypothetical protein D1AOALGA4SA_1604 [Olavius algarvensis Delta 1 endosymbiont]|nr:hypothetical protein D1AOALGA4SA_1604 [Olavius algarvensis Delta 1 endosymbiont]